MLFYSPVEFASMRRSGMKVIDITRKLDENIAVYEGDPRFSLETWRSIETDAFMLSKIRMGTHTGTHVDAPCHFIEGGKSIYELPLHTFVGRCVVTEDVSKCDLSSGRVLIKSTDKSRMTPAQAQRLADSHVRLVGTELMSVGGDEVHKILLGAGCVILEWIDLSKVRPGKYTLSAAPLKIDADGSPVRACLITED